MIFNSISTKNDNLSDENSSLLEKRTVTELTENEMIAADGGSTPACLWLVYGAVTAVYLATRD